MSPSPSSTCWTPTVSFCTPGGWVPPRIQEPGPRRALLVPASHLPMPAQGSCISRGAPSLGPKCPLGTTVSTLPITTLYRNVPFPDPSPAGSWGGLGELWGSPAPFAWHRTEKGLMGAGLSHSWPRSPKSKPPCSWRPDPLLLPGQGDAVLTSTPTGHGKPSCTLARRDLKQTRKFTLERS